MTDDTTQAAPALREIFDRKRLGHIAMEMADISPAFDSERFLLLPPKISTRSASCSVCGRQR